MHVPVDFNKMVEYSLSCMASLEVLVLLVIMVYLNFICLDKFVLSHELMWHVCSVVCILFEFFQCKDIFVRT